MMSALQFNAVELYIQLFKQAQENCGNHGLAIAPYKNRLEETLRKYLRPPYTALAVVNFFKETHTDDLYLTTACAEGIETAWPQFDRLFRNYITQLAKQELQNPDAAEDLANSVIANLYFSDTSNRPRIASYDGQASLSCWLRIMVSHRAADERKRKWNQFEGLDAAEQFVDANSLEKLDARMRARRYRPFIAASLKDASQTLTPQERTRLLMKYDQLLESKQIAEILGVHPSTVTRLLEQIRQKIKRQVMAILADRHTFSSEAILECVTEVMVNPEYPLLEFLKAGEDNLLSLL